MVLAEVNGWDVFWTMLWFFFLFIWLIILFNILVDLFRDHSLSGWAKAAWVIFLVVLPFLAVLVYVIARGPGMAERSRKEQAAAQKQFDSYVQGVAGGASPAHQIATAKELLDNGSITQDEQLKAKALS
jgi:hypothetical protein